MMKPSDPTILWLLEGDPSIRYQTLRDLVHSDPKTCKKEQSEISSSGWGARLLALQDKDGMWGRGLYSPKWTSTTYTMLLLKDFGLEQSHPQAHTACSLLLEMGFYPDEGIHYFKSMKHSETCVTGMILSILSHFRFQDNRIHRLAAHLRNQQMEDGGWNCNSYEGAVHGSFHTTINVLEGLHAYAQAYPGHARDVESAQEKGREFLLAHKLYRSHRTGSIVDPKMTRLSFPPRWRYDMLRALDCFRAAEAPCDPRMDDALGLLMTKRSKDGRWPLQQNHPGRIYFEMEKTGAPSRWNTLRALRVLFRYGRTHEFETLHPAGKPEPADRRKRDQDFKTI